MRWEKWSDQAIETTTATRSPAYPPWDPPASGAHARQSAVVNQSWYPSRTQDYDRDDGACDAVPIRAYYPIGRRLCGVCDGGGGRGRGHHCHPLHLQSLLYRAMVRAKGRGASSRIAQTSRAVRNSRLRTGRPHLYHLVCR
jgi:hypothetical protein